MFHRFTRRVKITGAATILLLLIAFYGIVEWRARNENQRQYDAVVAGVQRSDADMRGLIDRLVQFRKEFVPAFLPQHLWSDEYCAATIVTAVNFLTGTRTLEDGAAWQFSRINAPRLKKLYERPQDFAFEQTEKGAHRLVETFDRPMRLSEILAAQMSGGTTDRIVIVGYHYRQTQSDEKLWRAKADLNTHLMLLLGRYDGTWYGYHMLHDQIGDVIYPFRIDSVSDYMPDWFDIVYLWEVFGTELAPHGSALAFAQDLSSYHRAKFVNQLPGFGRANVALLGDTDQFPRIVEEIDGVYPIVAETRETFARGMLLGFAGSASIRYNRGRSTEADRGDFGLRGQCVEFANRFLSQVTKFKNMSRTGDADTYFFSAVAKGLAPFANGSTEKPMVGDLIVFDGGLTDRNPGHVAVVTVVKDDAVCIAQQNAHPWHQCLPLVQNSNGGWTVAAFDEKLPCAGWTRVPQLVSERKPPEPTAEPKATTPPPAPRDTTIIKLQKVRKGLQHTVRAVVARTPGADLVATFACNGWDFTREATHKVIPGQIYKVCTWETTAHTISRNN